MSGPLKVLLHSLRERGLKRSLQRTVDVAEQKMFDLLNGPDTGGQVPFDLLI